MVSCKKEDSMRMAKKAVSVQIALAAIISAVITLMKAKMFYVAP